MLEVKINGKNYKTDKQTYDAMVSVFPSGKKNNDYSGFFAIFYLAQFAKKLIPIK